MRSIYLGILSVAPQRNHRRKTKYNRRYNEISNVGLDIPMTELSLACNAATGLLRALRYPRPEVVREPWNLGSCSQTTASWQDVRSCS